MIDDASLKQILLEQKELIKSSPENIKREELEKVSPLIKVKHIVVITGHRRSGKSVFLSQIVEKYYDYDEIYYMNFDDERLISLTIEDMNRVMEIFSILFGERKVIFLDEIQNLDGWELFVSRLYNEGYKIFITGSNAKLLSSELSTRLTGRYVEIEIYPFSFREFLTYKNVNIWDENLIYKKEIKALIRKHFDDYIVNGGFPEIIRYGTLFLLKNLFSDVITKDVIGRYGIRETKTFKEISYFLLSTISSEFSYNRIKNIYSLGSVHTVKNYIDYLTSAYLFFEVPRFSHSIKETQTRIKKIYIVDNGFINALKFSSSQDVGKLYENIVFTELKRRGKEVLYFKDKNGKEVDFIAKVDGINELIQVSYNINDQKTLKREIKSLLSAMDIFKVKEGFILTENREEIIKIEDKNIIFTPLWKWLLKSDDF